LIGGSRYIDITKVDGLKNELAKELRENIYYSRKTLDAMHQHPQSPFTRSGRCGWLEVGEPRSWHGWC
jgi:hypothetical protein